MKHGLGFAIVLVILAYSYDRVVFLIKDCMDVIPLAVVFAIGLSALSAYFTLKHGGSLVPIDTVFISHFLCNGPFPN